MASYRRMPMVGKRLTWFEARRREASRPRVKGAWKKNLRKRWPLLLLLLPALVYVFVFSYVPMYGVLIAWQDYMPGDPILGPGTFWVGWGNFERFFAVYNFNEIFLNTFLLSLLGFLVGFPIPILVSLMLNAMKSKRMSKALQTLFYTPHFISLVVMVGILYVFFGSSGLYNSIALNAGWEQYSFFLEPEAFRPLFVLSGTWQDFGWNAVIYLAALSSVDPQLYEAADMDGASRFRKVIHIDIPAILPTVSMILVLSVGNLMSTGYEKVLLMQTDANLSTSEILSTFIYKSGLTRGADYGMSTAAGLFNSLINLGLLVFANISAKKISGNGLW